MSFFLQNQAEKEAGFGQNLIQKLDLVASVSKLTRSNGGASKINDSATFIPVKLTALMCPEVLDFITILLTTCKYRTELQKGAVLNDSHASIYSLHDDKAEFFQPELLIQRLSESQKQKWMDGLHRLEV